MGFFNSLGNAAKLLAEKSYEQQMKKKPLYKEFSKYGDGQLRGACEFGNYSEQKMAEFILRERGYKI